MRNGGNRGNSMPLKQMKQTTILLAAALVAPALPQQPQTTIKTEVALVNVVLSVLDRNNHFVNGLKADDFTVFEDHQPQKVEYFSVLGKGNDIPLTIALRGDFGANFGVLKKFADETGGSFFSPRARLAEMEAAFRSINEELQGQYSLAYTSTNKRRDGALRAIEIRPKVGGLRVRARK